MRISLFEEGHQNVTPSGEIIEDWEDLVDIMTYVKGGAKNGKYYVRGFCDGSRADENITMDLIIIDGDSTTDNGASCVPPQDIHRVMKAANIRHVIHTSHSNDLVNNRHKWRMAVPCLDLVDVEALVQGVAEIIAGLHRAGIPVRNVGENNRISQPWYLPRCPIGREEDFWCESHDGEVYQLTGEDVVDHSTINEKKRDDTGIFNWNTVFDLFSQGTLHQGLVSATGWLILTTDWADGQIKQHLLGLVQGLCPDQTKIKRAIDTKEIDNIIKHCRDKAGSTVEVASDWRDHHITGEELENKEFPPVKWAVSELIPEGLTTLAGDPKVGKSLLAVDICSAISNGGEAFGCQECVQGSAVYVSLEDPQRRVKDRIKNMVDKWSATFHLVDGGVPKLGIDFYKMFDEWMILWPDIRCIIIDTMSFVIPEKKNGVSDYDHYYSVLDPLHRWSLENKVAVVCITHKKKGTKSEADNPFDGIIGSTAISGCSDAMIMLTKNHAKSQDATNIELADGFLDVAGREIATDHFALEFDSELIKWTLRGKILEKDLTSNANDLLVLTALKDKKLKQQQLSEEIKMNKNTTKSCLRRLKEANIVGNDEEGWFRIDVDYEKQHKESWNW